MHRWPTLLYLAHYKLIDDNDELKMMQESRIMVIVFVDATHCCMMLYLKG